MKNRLYLITIVFGVGLASILLSCNSKNEDNKEESAYVPKTDTVVIRGMQFHPASLTIHEGDTVVWINNGIVTHDITVDSLKNWTSGNIEVGKVWKKVPSESFDYFCSIHPTMTGSIRINNESE